MKRSRLAVTGVAVLATLLFASACVNKAPTPSASSTLKPAMQVLTEAADKTKGQSFKYTLTYGEVLTGLARLAREFPRVESISIDTWGVDYGLLDAEGALLAEPVSHRDGRTTAAIDDVHARIGREELYQINGLQFMPINTIYQLAAEQGDPMAAGPGLIGFFTTR